MSRVKSLKYEFRLICAKTGSMNFFHSVYLFNQVISVYNSRKIKMKNKTIAESEIVWTYWWDDFSHADNSLLIFADLHKKANTSTKNE